MYNRHIDLKSFIGLCRGIVDRSIYVVVAYDMMKYGVNVIRQCDDMIKRVKIK